MMYISFYDSEAMLRFMRAVWELAQDLERAGMTGHAERLKAAYCEFEREAVRGPNNPPCPHPNDPSESPSNTTGM